MENEEKGGSPPKEEKKQEPATFSFSKLKEKFKKTAVPAGVNGDEMALDLSGVAGWFKGHKKWVIFALLIVLLGFSAYLRYLPEKQYTGVFANGLTAMDPYWHYRHAKDVLDHGYVGDEIKIINGKAIYWDTMHDAPEGGIANQDFLPYFTAYTYKYLGKFFAPNLLVWLRWTPIFFGTLAVLGMFLLAKHFFGPVAGLASGFLLSLAPSIISRTVAGFADTDGVVIAFTVFVFYFFAKAWDSSSYAYAAAGGLSLGLFGIAWASYTFAPLLMLSMVGFFFIFDVGPKFLADNKNPVQLVKGHFAEHWKKYVVFIIVFGIGLTLVGMSRGMNYVNPLNAIKTVLHLKVNEVAATSVEGEVIRDVYMTVAEMNPSSWRETVARLHLAPVLLCLAFAALLPFGLWSKIKGQMHHVGFLALLLGASMYMSLRATRFIEILAIPICFFAGISIAFAVSKMDKKKPVLSVIIALCIFVSIFALPNLPIAKGEASGPSFYALGKASALQTGPSENQNWYDFAKWAQEETPKGAIFASWWDPGHFVTAAAERPAVADGCQNSAHVHDLAVTFTTTNESVAVDRLKKYNVSYFFTSNDLISKYGAISFLANGQGENYPVIYLSEQKNTASGTVLVYPFSQDASFLVNLKQDGITASIRQGYQSQAIKRIFYVQDSQGYVAENPDPNALDGMLYLMPGFKQAIFLPFNLENNMLTRLHFFNGNGMEHFELVKSFGEEIKIFKVIYE